MTQGAFRVNTGSLFPALHLNCPEFFGGWIP